MSGTHAVLGENTSTNTHVFLSMLMIVLASPSLNPVLLFCEALSIPPIFFSTLAVVFLIHTLGSDAHNIVYYATRIFFHSILSIFFRSIEVVGAENIPPKGPAIFTGNHNNQVPPQPSCVAHEAQQTPVSTLTSLCLCVDSVSSWTGSWSSATHGTAWAS